MRKSYLPLLTNVRTQLAKMVNADVQDCVIVRQGGCRFGGRCQTLMVGWRLPRTQVPNATLGINTVTWNIDWKPSDVIVACK